MATTVEEHNVASDYGAASLGTARWVQFTFIVLALTAFWFFDHLISAVWNIFADPNLNVATGCAALIAVVLGIILYRNSTVYGFVSEAAVELSKVSWPTPKETWNQTIVVVVVSIISAVLIGIFDSVWVHITDLIYGS